MLVLSCVRLQTLTHGSSRHENATISFAAVLLFVAAPAFAQWQTPNHSVPLGRGGGIQGFGNALPGVAGQPLVSTGPTTDPAFGNIANSGFAAGAADTYKGSSNGTSCCGCSQGTMYGC